MDFSPSDDQRLIAQAARDYARRALAPRAAGRDREGTFPDAELREMGALGFLGVNVPQDQGGTAAGAGALAHVIAELAHADASVAVTVAVTNMVAEILSRFGSSRVQATLVPALCAGDLGAGAFALSEPHAGSDPASMRTTATPVDSGFVLRGSKQWITSGDRAGVYVIIARLPDNTSARARFSAFAVTPATPGLSLGRREEKMGQHGSSTVALGLDDVFVPVDALLGTSGEGLSQAMSALDGGRINIAAQAYGIGRAALDVARVYAKQRVQFGKPIAEFQAIQLMLADMAIELEAAWLLVGRGAWMKDTGARGLGRAAAQAKLWSTERAVAVCDRALQILGGYGYTSEFPIERFFRDVRVTTIYEGTSQIQRIVIARNLLKELAETQHAARP